MVLLIVVFFVSASAVVLMGLWRSLGRSFPGSRLAFFALALLMTGWMALVWWLAVRGTFVFRFAGRGGPRVPAMPLAMILPLLVAGVLLILGARRVAKVLDDTPVSWLIAVQGLRLIGGVFFYEWARGSLPGIFAWEAGTLDIVVGLSALPMARWVSSQPARARTAAVLWNFFGLADFVLAFGIVSSLRSFPHALGINRAMHVTLGDFPIVMIPAFGVPNAILWHVLSLWQLKRANRDN
jgi:hypothetical protein